ncbi:alpha/beta hydrolase family protein [Herbidospora daliensis]|uniref:alpha/beta hydrolase family protein n=1 Tax=Herbidospora daliensis TaxID=295585 RepID=UPI000786797A|nr:acetylhydrolase [Herbidospora daliensis]
MRRLLAAALLTAVAASACSAPEPPRSAAPSAAPARPVTLPVPAGGPIGSTVLHLTDASRPDPWDESLPARELKVTLWYPTKPGDGPRAPYMSVKEAELLLTGTGMAPESSQALSQTRTHAVRDADPAGRGLPLVVLSPGFTKPMSTLTSLAEDLAARGYVVAGIDHTHESYATTLADGRVVGCLACESSNDPGFRAGLVRGRAADVSFVLDRLTTAYPHLIDRERIAMAGQSIGGAAAVAAMVADPRIRAGIDMDGTTYARIPDGGLSRPFLFLGTPQHAPGGLDHSWDRDWRKLTGWRRWLVVDRAEHQTFTDVPLVAGVIGLESLPGMLPAARGAELTRAYVAAFLDLHLRGRPQPLLDGPSPRHPEVRFAAQ